MKVILHHGMCKNEFSPVFIGTDYFTFYHKPCTESEKWQGHAEITSVLIDNAGRVIFNLKCRSCGAVDALKTTPNLFMSANSEPLRLEKVFYLSPKLKACVKHHRWDNF